jgi:polysaccharide export outer membrane protein
MRSFSQVKIPSSRIRLEFAAVATVATLATCVISCSGPGKYVWVEAFDDGGEWEPEKPYALSAGDLIEVRVFNQDHLATKARVRGDGKITMPLLNDVVAAGLTPVALAANLQARLKDFINAPLVTVSLEETRPSTVYVTGEVAKPGVYPLDSAHGVLQALVNAGGLTEHATSDRIFVLRQAPWTARIRFTYDALTRLRGKAASFRLRSGDIVVVE